MLRAESPPEEPPEATQLLQIVATYKTEPHHDRYSNIVCKQLSFYYVKLKKDVTNVTCPFRIG